ncbi:hypothetical protein BH10PSE13_BH10PSE13_25360 [soil metagenome]
MNARALFPALPALPAGKRYRLLRRPPDSILPSSPRPVRRDCHGRLIAALIDKAGGDCAVADATLTPWASATFIGARHGITLILRGGDAAVRAEALTAMLPDADFAIPGHIVADLAPDAITAIGAEEVRLVLSILTIEAW